MSFLTDLPPGYDDRTHLALGPGNCILASHPEQPPIRYDEHSRCWVLHTPTEQTLNAVSDSVSK